VIRPFFRKKLWTGGYDHQSGSASHTGGGGAGRSGSGHLGSRKHMGMSVELTSKSDGRSARRGSESYYGPGPHDTAAGAQVSKTAGIHIGEHDVDETGSMERIVKSPAAPSESGSGSDDGREPVRFPHGEIRIMQTYEVNSTEDGAYPNQGMGGQGWVG
jgi:hypothetical protein